MDNPFLIGVAIYLRPLEPEDVPMLTQWTTQPEFQTALDLFYRPLEPTPVEIFLECTKNDEHDIALGIVEKETDALLGFIGLNAIDQENDHVQLGFFLGAWGDGVEQYALEAVNLIQSYVFDDLKMHRLWLYVDASNERMRALFEQMGCSCEATLRQDRFSEGRYNDTVILGMLKGGPAREKSM